MCHKNSIAFRSEDLHTTYAAYNTNEYKLPYFTTHFTLPIQAYTVFPPKLLKMHFSSLSVLIIAATSAIATPLGSESGVQLVQRNGQLFERRNGLVKLASEKVGDGEFSGWGVDELQSRDEVENAPEPTRTVQLAERVECEHNPKPSCDTSYRARDDDCERLQDRLFEKREQNVPDGWQSYCYKGDVGECCVSWSDPVEGLKYGDLEDPSDEIRRRCASNGISGLIRGKYVTDVCVHVCLSNRDSDNCGH